MKKPLFLVPIGVVMVLFAIFAYALISGVDPRNVPSALTGKALPEFKLSQLEDDKQFLTTADVSGEPMLVNIWATWCASCKYEHPVLNSLAASGVKIIGINYKDERELALQWLQDYADPYAINIYDPVGNLGFDLGVTGAPETFFVDSNGLVQYRFQGPITTELWQTQLKAIFDDLV